MKHIDILETEYKEQYNQYRWIGQMQSYVLTLYIAVIVFSFSAMAALLPKPTSQIDYFLPAIIIFVLGLLGVFVSFGLFHSRTMQRRTALYLRSLLLQMITTAEDYSLLKESSLRFRNLTSTKASFKLSDTVNIAILITIYLGELFLLVGIYLLIFVVWKPNSCWAVCIYVVMVVLFLIIPIKLLPCLMNRQTDIMNEEYISYDKITLNQMKNHFKLPKHKSN